MRRVWITLPMMALITACATGTMEDPSIPNTEDAAHTALLEFSQDNFAIAIPPANWNPAKPAKNVLAGWINPMTKSRMGIGANVKLELLRFSWSGWNDVFLISAKEKLHTACMRFSVTQIEGFAPGVELNGFRRHINDAKCLLSESERRNWRTIVYLRKCKDHLYWMSLNSPLKSYETDIEAFEAMVRSFRLINDH